MAGVEQDASIIVTIINTGKILRNSDFIQSPQLKDARGLKNQFEEIGEFRGKTRLICDLDLWVITSKFIIQRTLPSRIHRPGRVCLRHLGEADTF